VKASFFRIIEFGVIVRQNKEDCQNAVLFSNAFLNKYAVIKRTKPMNYCLKARNAKIINNGAL
jgi:hypothetical protein